MHQCCFTFYPKCVIPDLDMAVRVFRGLRQLTPQRTETYWDQFTAVVVIDAHRALVRDANYALLFGRLEALPDAYRALVHDANYAATKGERYAAVPDGR